MNKQPVIQLIDSLNVGGAEMMAINIANLLDAEGYDSHICSTRQEGALKTRINNKENYIFLSRNQLIDIRALQKLLKYIRKNSIATIHAHSTSLFFAVLIKLFYWRVKIVWHDHYGVSSDFSQRPTFKIKILSYFVNTILSVNKDLCDWAKKNLNCKNVLYFPNFADLDNNEEKRTKLNGKQGKRIIIVAALRAQKDHFNLLKAFKTLSKEDNEVSLHIVGSDYNDEYSVELKQLVKSYSLQENVFFYGAVNDVKNVLMQADIAVLSSKSEGLPVALLEYGLSGIASVSTDVGQCSQVIPDKNLLVPSRNSSLLSQKIKLLIDDIEYRNKSAEALQINVTQNFGKESYKNRLIEVYSVL